MSDQRRYTRRSGRLSNAPIESFWSPSLTATDPQIPNLPLEDVAAAEPSPGDASPSPSGQRLRHATVYQRWAAGEELVTAAAPVALDAELGPVFSPLAKPPVLAPPQWSDEVLSWLREEEYRWAAPLLQAVAAHYLPGDEDTLPVTPIVPALAEEGWLPSFRPERTAAAPLPEDNQELSWYFDDPYTWARFIAPLLPVTQPPQDNQELSWFREDPYTWTAFVRLPLVAPQPFTDTEVFRATPLSFEEEGQPSIYAKDSTRSTVWAENDEWAPEVVPPSDTGGTGDSLRVGQRALQRPIYQRWGIPDELPQAVPFLPQEPEEALFTVSRDRATSIIWATNDDWTPYVAPSEAPGDVSGRPLGRRQHTSLYQRWAQEEPWLIPVEPPAPPTQIPLGPLGWEDSYWKAKRLLRERIRRDLLRGLDPRQPKPREPVLASVPAPVVPYFKPPTGPLSAPQVQEALLSRPASCPSKQRRDDDDFLTMME